MTQNDNLIDARGLKCPLPVLKLERRLAEVEVGAIVTVIATDPMAKVDIPLYCRQHGHGLVQQEVEGAWQFGVTKAA